MVHHNLIHLVENNAATQPAALTGLIRRVGQSRFGRAFAHARQPKPNDPYLLILLADQELLSGREQQAKSLVEAAYESFDRKADPGGFRLHLAG